MLTTARITSDFDVELQLGGGWFKTAIGTLADAGIFSLPNGGAPIVDEVFILPADPEWDLEITIVGLAIPILARAELSPDGSQLTLTANLSFIPPQTIPFGALTGLAGPPVLRKLAGDDDHEDAIAIMANLDIHAESQDGDPLPAGERVERGNPALAQSFLPANRDIAFGMGAATYDRFANNLWHTNLRAADGSHPLPDQANAVGRWTVVKMTGRSGALRVTLEGFVPVDWLPDPEVKVTLILTPTITDGQLTFRIDTEEDIDTGLLGNLLAAIGVGIVGALIGLVIGIFTGGIFLGLLIGFTAGALAGAILLEVAEVVVEGMVRKEIRARLNGDLLPSITAREDSIVQLATPDAAEGMFSLSVLDAIPASISVFNQNPANELLYRQNLLVTSAWADVSVTRNGFALAGVAGTAERFEPEIVSIVAVTYTDDVLESVTYRRINGLTQTLSLDEIRARTSEGELQPPVRLVRAPDDATHRIPGGKLACVCLDPLRIHREDTIVTEIEFANGIRLRTPDAVALQQLGAIVIAGYQLIQPRDYNAYFRAKADELQENNFERLPEYQM